ncbi:MAG: tetratricopeptide repeat protein [Verrucomicrobiota bacterium]
MNRTFRLFSALAIPLISSGTLHAQTKQEPVPPPPVAQAGGTADELFAQAKKLFEEKNYQAALDSYLQFKSDYGDAPEAVAASFNTLFPIAICLVQLSKFTEAVPAITEALEKQGPNPQTQLTPRQRQDLTFWLGVAQLQEKNYAEARTALENFIALFPPDSEKNPLFVRQNPPAARIVEARAMIGTSYILEEKFQEAADFYAKLKPTLPPDTRGRAVIFQLYALEQLGDFDGAMKVVTEEYPNMGDIAQLISFQTLTLRLGNHWLEKGEFRKAIQCLQRVWTFDRLVKHQESRLEDLRSKLKAAEANTGDPYAKILYARLVGEVTRELENFRKVENFDTALRFRLAIAYLQMKRYREAALVMRQMIAELPPGPLTEQAALNNIRCWTALEDWPNSIAASQDFVQRFPDSKHLPEVVFMEAEALQSMLRNEEAAAKFLELAEKFPDSNRAAEARFLHAFALLQAEKNMEAAKAFEDFLQRQPTHSRADAAAYWLAMCYSFDQQFEKCRELMEQYLAKHPNGVHRGQAVFRMAYCLQQQEKYNGAIDELMAYLEKFPGDPENNEARVMLANALMNEGFMQDGIDELKKIPPEAGPLYEEGVFRTAEALKLLEEYEQYRDLMQGFVDRFPKSSRVAQAISNLGWYWRQQEQPEKARELYWQAIRDHGNDPSIRSVDDLFGALARLYRGPQESAQYLALLRDMTTEAEQKNETTLATRLLWAQAQALRKSDPEQSRNILLQAAARADVRKDNPILLVDFANALLDAGQDKDAEKILRDTLRWNPRALQKDRILASLGDIELKRGNDKAALALYTRFERENLGSTIFGPTMLSKARLHAKRGENDKARATLDSLLRAENIRSDIKAEALFTTGELYMQENNPQKALPYFIQVYNMYGRWRAWVAKSYLQGAEALSKLQENTKARRTLQEMLDNPDLEQTPEFPIARERLQALGGPLPVETTPASNPAAPAESAPAAPAQG